MDYFGFNEGTEGHRLFPWKPEVLKPNIARMGCWWDTPDWLIASVLEPLKLPEHPDRRAVLTVYGDRMPPDLGTYAAKVNAILNDHPQVMVQVWNEPNNPPFTYLTPEYVKDLHDAALFADVGRNRVIGTPVSPAIQGWREYMRTAYGGQPIPVGLHLYPTSVRNYLTQIEDQYELAKELAEGRGVHVTECGLQRGIFGGAQGTATRGAYDKLERLGARTVIFHRLWRPAELNEWEKKGRMWFLDNSGDPTGLVKAMNSAR